MIYSNILLTTDITAPTVPEEARKYFPEDVTSFQDGLLYIVKKGIEYTAPSIADAVKICAVLLLVVILVAILNALQQTNQPINALIGTVTISIVLIKPSSTLIQLAIDTVGKIGDYGKLLLPVMTSALAAEGGVTTATGLYTATMVLDTVLMSTLSSMLIPLTYCYMVVTIAYSAINNPFLGEIAKFIKWLCTWTLKITIYVFTGFVTITGVVSGTVDASAVKATKLAISGIVPVVGNIISDASETILISTGLLKNTAGIFGMLAILAIWIGPFLKIGIQYLLLKITAGLCGIWGNTALGKLVKEFASILGFLLAAIGTMCLLLLISTFCFMRGIGR